MKTTLFILALVSVLFVGCSGNSSHDHKEGTHTHEDGTVHEDHDHADSTKQEEFKVGGDTLSTKPN